MIRIDAMVLEVDGESFTLTAEEVAELGLSFDAATQAQLDEQMGKAHIDKMAVLMSRVEPVPAKLSGLDAFRQALAKKAEVSA